MNTKKRMCIKYFNRKGDVFKNVYQKKFLYMVKIKGFSILKVDNL